jgi:hypothetical protein
MRGFDWGKLVARLLAVLLAVDALSSAAYAWVQGGDLDKYAWLDRLTPLIPIVAAGLLWVFAGRFVGRGLEDSDDGDAERPASVLVASVASYFALHYGYATVSAFANQGRDAAGQLVSQLGIWFDLAVCIALVVVVWNARRVAAWVAR